MSQHFGPATPNKLMQPRGAIAVDGELVRQAQRVIGKLKARGQSLVISESYTAGFISSVLSQTEGAGEVLQRRFITLTNEEKTAELGVSQRLLAQNTSAAVVEAMAKGALARSSATIALAVTGDLASYHNGDRVGLAYFCCRNRFGHNLRIGKDFGDETDKGLMRASVVTGLTLLEDFVRKAG